MTHLHVFTVEILWK